MIYFGCPKCAAAMTSPASQAGQKETCPECGNVSIVPKPIIPAVPAGGNVGVQAQRQDGDLDRGTSYAPAHSRQVITTERTSKRLKLQVLVAWIAVLVGIGLVVAGCPRDGDDGHYGASVLGVLLIFCGLVWRLLAGISIWWRHG